MRWDWADAYGGTKAALQALGIGVGEAFPGELGCHLRLRTKDPRGYDVKVTHWLKGLFLAVVSFPGWPESPSRDVSWSDPIEGVRRRANLWHDEYRGRAEALAAAGLVHIDHFPGKPGMRKVRVQVLPDGSVLGGPPTAVCPATRLPGARCVERASASTYRVSIVVSEVESERRIAEFDRRSREWLAEVESLPRPARLDRLRPVGSPPPHRPSECRKPAAVRRPLPAGWAVHTGGQAQEARHV